MIEKNNSVLSIRSQYKLIGLNRSNYYYQDQGLSKVVLTSKTTLRAGQSQVNILLILDPNHQSYYQ